MADPDVATPADADPGAARPTAADPAQRGELVLQDKVVVRIAERAALDIRGVMRQSGRLSKVTGRDLPRVSATIAGSRARIRLEVAVVWPQPLSKLAATVRDQVGQRVATLTGLQVDAVDVSIRALVSPDDATNLEGRVK
ncbi:MAG: Asp23/Gls24 family envelope stress response protein [Nocardioidaceae bacterium]